VDLATSIYALAMVASPVMRGAGNCSANVRVSLEVDLYPARVHHQLQTLFSSYIFPSFVQEVDHEV
jgi:hypothetical protein